MNPTEHDLERLLRRAPRPVPPPGLRQTLLRGAPAESGQDARAPGAHSVRGGVWRWLDSWRLTIATAGLALAALGLAAAQQLELRELRRQVEDLRQQLESRAAPAAAAVPVASDPDLAGRERQDLERLRTEVARLQTEQADAGRLAAQNQRLRDELAALARQALPGEFEALREARDRAQRITCVNNIKQLGLAVRLYAVDHKDVFPPDIRALSNEVAALKVPVCPADTNRQPAVSWAAFTAANTSYEYLAADGKDTDPYRVLFRCAIHRGNVGLCDGSVQQLTEAMQAERLVTREGRLYMKGGPESAPAGGRRP